MNRLLVGGVAAILVTALAPHALDAWRAHRLRQQIDEQEQLIAQKQREIACLERLRATGLPPGASIEKEIERCRRAAAEPPD
ncbi:MAG: hypothetical protein M3N07_06870 [Pseudomonadota bacterium]|nr:hypothetical protein [Pseudomonadota bacterium]